MDKNFAIDVSGCSQEQVKEMADWLCGRFDDAFVVNGGLDNDGDKYNFLLIDDRGLYVTYLDASYWPDKDFFTYIQALEIMRSEQTEYKEQNAHKADLAMGDVIDRMGKAGHNVRDAVCNEEYTGSSVSYYTVDVINPTTMNLPYQAECNDIIEALDMNYAEGNAFKAIWRKCAARKLGKSKKGYDNGLYDAEKVVFFGDRMVEQCKQENQA